MTRLLLLVLACGSVAFARGTNALDGKNVTISAKGRALCSGRPILGGVQLVLKDIQCATCPMAPRIIPFAEAKTDERGNYHVEASVAVPTHRGMVGYSTIYVDLAHQCGRFDLPPFAYSHEQADIPTEYWNAEGGGKKVFEHDFLLNITQAN